MNKTRKILGKMYWLKAVILTTLLIAAVLGITTCVQHAQKSRAQREQAEKMLIGTTVQAYWLQQNWEEVLNSSGLTTLYGGPITRPYVSLENSKPIDEKSIGNEVWLLDEHGELQTRKASQTYDMANMDDVIWLFWLWTDGNNAAFVRNQLGMSSEQFSDEEVTTYLQTCLERAVDIYVSILRSRQGK